MTARVELNDPLLRKITKKIVDNCRPRRIVLFGSRARGDAGPDSDYDLMIEMETPLPMPERAMAIDRLFGLRDWSMDVFVFTPREIAEMRDRVGTVGYAVERDGVAIYERV